MNDREQNAVIAKVCGWNWSEANHIWQSPNGSIWGYPPVYTRDLNAMNRAEKTLSEDDRHGYYRYLYLITRPLNDKVTPGCSPHTWAFINASAAQRAEAFLKTVGKWEEST